MNGSFNRALNEIKFGWKERGILLIRAFLHTICTVDSFPVEKQMESSIKLDKFDENKNYNS